MVGPSNQIFQANFVNTGNKAVAVATIERSGKITKHTDTHESNVSRDIFMTGIIGVPSSKSVIILQKLALTGGRISRITLRKDYSGFRKLAFTNNFQRIYGKLRCITTSAAYEKGNYYKLS